MVVRLAKAEMNNWDLLAEQKQLTVDKTTLFQDSWVNYYKAERELSLLLKQKSCVKWAVEGDENNHFFHGLVRGRIQRNTIKGVISNGVWEEKPTNIKEAAFQYFSNQFREPNVARPSFSCERFKKLSPSQADSLVCPFSEYEIKSVVWSYGDSKASGPDGFTFAFLKAHWETIKFDVMSSFQEFATSGKILKGGNSTFLTLIPKKSDPLSLDDYRPISLVGCQYKILGKVLAEGLKTVMSHLIYDNQSAFVGARQILDGVLMANEAVNWAHIMKLKLLLLKVDFAKAFDCINWEFLDETMRQMNFSLKWRLWIKGCLKSTTISVLVNGSPTVEFPMQRGLRQGNPLSPFLFLIVVEALSVMRAKACSQGIYRGLKIGNDRLELPSVNGHSTML